MKRKGLFRSGTSGLVIPVPNKQAFPPEYRDKSRLTYYASLFNSIEINSSFYKVPMGSTVRKWSESVPDDFRFTFKLWKEITHGKGFTPDLQSVDKFMTVIDQVGTKKGSLLIQLPPSVTIDKSGQLEKIFERVKDSGWQTAIEFRHPSWYIPEVFEIADEYHLSVVMHDMPKSYNMEFNKKARFVYLRFHGKEGDYKGGYTDEELMQHATRVKEWLSQGKDVYVYFNNTIGDAITNVMTLNKMVSVT
jgi:uncharacterized protein YecE (DUF72 family)